MKKWQKFYEIYSNVVLGNRRERYEMAEEYYFLKHGKYAYRKDFRMFEALFVCITSA